MKMNELCHKYGLTRKAVHFYIQSGLLHPKKEENNYYSFDAANEEELKLVLRLRKAGMSIEAIHDMISYPTCSNFFLFRQRYILKKEIAEKVSAVMNIERLCDEIPPNGTPSHIMTADASLIRKETFEFSEKDAYLTARMTAIFLFTPFMSQEVDDYRQYIWNKIVSITRNELADTLPLIADHLAGLEAADVAQLSSELAYRFISIMEGENEKHVSYLLEMVRKLIKDEKMKKIWIQAYDRFITPVKRIHIRCHKTLIREYASQYGQCMKNMAVIIQECLETLTEEDRNKLLQATGNRFDFDSDEYGDLFILFCMEDSVFLSPSLHP